MGAQVVKVELSEGRSFVFVRGQSKVYFSRDEAGGCWSMRTGHVLLADGSVLDAILEICDSDSGEHWGTGIWTAAGIAWQDQAGFLKLLGRTREQVFPYRYRYDGGTIAGDIHIEPDGWSRT